MTKQEFTSKLSLKLSGLPKRDIKERVQFYSEMIDDRMEEGLSERDAILAIGSIDEIALQIRNEFGSEKEDRDDKASKRKLSAWQTAAAIIGSPVWVPLLIVAASLVLVAYILIWVLVITFWAIELPFFILAFLSKYLFIFCKKASVCALSFTKVSFSHIVNTFKGEE